MHQLQTRSPEAANRAALQMVMSLILGMLVGAVQGLTGAGGGILAVPVLMASLGWDMRQAAPVALVAVAGSAAVGAAEGLRRNLVRYRAALLMVGAGVPFTGLGTRLAHLLPQAWLMAAFASLLLLVAGRLLRQTSHEAREEEENPANVWARINAETGRFHWTWSAACLLGVIGAATGFMAGLLGVGGGFVIVPMLRRFTSLDMHGIVATSLMVIALVGAGGVLSALAYGAELPASATAAFAAAAVGGMVTARILGRRLSPFHVQRAFAFLLVAVACGMFAKAVSA